MKILLFSNFAEGPTKIKYSVLCCDVSAPNPNDKLTHFQMVDIHHKTTDVRGSDRSGKLMFVFVL